MISTWKTYIPDTEYLKKEFLPSSKDAPFIQRVKMIIYYHMEDDQFDVSILAQKTHISNSQLNRKLNSLIGQTAGNLIRKTRMEYAARLLTNRQGSIKNVAFAVGYKHQSHFCRSFKDWFGCTPSKYLKQSS